MIIDFWKKNEINITTEKSQQINYQLKPHHKSVEQIWAHPILNNYDHTRGIVTVTLGVN